MSLSSKIEEMVESYKKDHTHPMNRATHAIGIPLVVLSLGLFFFHPGAAAALFVVGWIFQFVGHAFEGKPPSFFRDPRYLLIGPTWLAQTVAARLGLTPV